MTFSIKQDVEVREMHPAVITAWPTIMQVFARYGMRTTLTSGNEGEHKANSLHKVIPCRACDWRTWRPQEPGVQIDDGLRAAIVLDLRQELGPDWDVVGESTHIHTEFDPK